MDRKVVTYGLEETADYTARDVESAPDGMTFIAYQKEAQLGNLRIRLRGRHNVSQRHGRGRHGDGVRDFTSSRIQRALGEFSGIQRRFELIGDVNGNRGRGRLRPSSPRRSGPCCRRRARLGQPAASLFSSSPTGTRARGTYWRNSSGPSMRPTDWPFFRFTRRREEPIPGVDARQIFQGVREPRGPCASRWPNGLEEAQDYLQQAVQPGDLVITPGSGETSGRRLRSSCGVFVRAPRTPRRDTGRECSPPQWGGAKRRENAMDKEAWMDLADTTELPVPDGRTDERTGRPIVSEGEADALVIPETLEALQEVLAKGHAEQIPITHRRRRNQSPRVGPGAFGASSSRSGKGFDEIRVLSRTKEGAEGLCGRRCPSRGPAATDGGCRPWRTRISCRLSRATVGGGVGA